MGVRTAEKLLMELGEKGEGNSKRSLILRNNVLLASGNKAAMERALGELTATAKDVRQRNGVL